jgi:hypothetical protein
MSNERAGLRDTLLRDHYRIEELAQRVAACVDADDPHGALEEWRAFEPAMLSHMDVEEMHVLPRLEALDAVEAARLREEHASIRAELGEIGLALELHAARKAMFDPLVARLWRHTESEDGIMYAWAERSLPERVIDAIRRRLRQS